MLNGDWADAVGQAGELLQAVSLQPPVPRLTHHSLAMNQGRTQSQTVFPALTKLQHSESKKKDFISHYFYLECAFGVRHQNHGLEICSRRLV